VYWNLKRVRTPIPDILAHVGAKDVVDEYIQKRLARIETPGYLVYDRVHFGAHKALSALKRRHRLVLMTLRRSAGTLHEELQSLELLPLFAQVLSSGEQLDPRWKVKVGLARSNGYEVGIPGMLVGDTENDILAGKRLGLQTVGILSGIRTRRCLEAVNPDVILLSIVELVSLLEVT